MFIGGLQKLTLIDYPGKIACTVFTLGCNMRCPFCHNPELIVATKDSPRIAEREFFDFLKKRIGKLDGVCITGGEPTIHADIISFIAEIKKLGFLVKLDTNGISPDILENLIDKKLIDYIAMDIKHAPALYEDATGVKMDMDKIRKSVSLIMSSPIPYEFRTTAVPGIHKEEDFLEIGAWIRGAQAYYIQEYREIKIFDLKLKDKTGGKTIDLERILQSVKGNFTHVGIRK